MPCGLGFRGPPDGARGGFESALRGAVGRRPVMARGPSWPLGIVVGSTAGRGPRAREPRPFPGSCLGQAWDGSARQHPPLPSDGCDVCPPDP